jgi:hypothetical protein
VALLLIVVTRGRVLADATLIALPRSLTGEAEGATYVGPAVPAGQELAYLVLDCALSLNLPLSQCAKPFASVGPAGVEVGFVSAGRLRPHGGGVQVLARLGTARR